jgi:hypothetical protein
MNAVHDANGNGRQVTSVLSDGGGWSPISWRNGVSGQPDLYVAIDCKNGMNCFINEFGALVPTTDAFSETGKRVQALDSAQHFLNQFAGIMTSNVTMRSFSSACPPGVDACASSKSRIDVVNTNGLVSGITITHELGHLLQMQIFNLDTLVDDCTKNGNGWSPRSDEWDSCASQEGVATYTGVTSWYDGFTATAPNLWGENFEDPNPAQATCTQNRGRALQVAKAFWDMDDVNNEGPAGTATGNDDTAFFNTDIMFAYGQFAPGTANRQRQEADAHGVNVRDYVANTNSAVFGATTTQSVTMLNHNCLGSQDPF